MKKTSTLRSRKKKQRIVDGAAFALLLFLAFCVMLPIWWIFRSSLMTNAELFYWPPKFLPPNWLFSNYKNALQYFPFWKYFKNTMTIIVPSVLAGTITATMGGYAFARLRFKGKRFLFTLVVGSMFLPTMVTLIPLYIMWSQVFHLTDSFLLLILPYFCGGGAQPEAGEDAAQPDAENGAVQSDAEDGAVQPDAEDGAAQPETEDGIAELAAAAEGVMTGFDVESVFDMGTEDGSMAWSVTLTNKSDQYMEFGDIGLPMPWNNKYRTIDDTYNNRLTVHSFAGADSGYMYAIRCSGEGNYMLFTPDPETGARIEYVDYWVGNYNGLSGEHRDGVTKNGSWVGDGGGWYPGLSVCYIHSKDIWQKTGRGYLAEDPTSLVLGPNESKTYTFHFTAVRAGDNTPTQENSDSISVEERENNMRSALYQAGMIDAVAVPGFQTALNMNTLLDLHYDENQISDVNVAIKCVHQNDPYDEAHIPTQVNGMVDNSRGGEGAHKANGTCAFVETKTVDGEQHHIYQLQFGCIGNNSVCVSYKLNGVTKYTQFEFNALAQLDQIAQTHAKFMVEKTQDKDTTSPTYGIYSDWFIGAETIDPNQRNHWGDDWSHDNINFITMKNYLDPDPDEIRSIVDEDASALQAIVPFTVRGTAQDDDATSRFTFKWTVESKPGGAVVTIANDARAYTEVKADMAGDYTLRLTVSDGALEGHSDLTLTLGAAPARQQPTITELSGEQDSTNASTAQLSVSAEADPLYAGELTYAWTVESRPEGSNPVIAKASEVQAILLADKPGDYVVKVTVTRTSPVRRPLPSP